MAEWDTGLESVWNDEPKIVMEGLKEGNQDDSRNKRQRRKGRRKRKRKRRGGKKKQLKQPMKFPFSDRGGDGEVDNFGIVDGLLSVSLRRLSGGS